MDTTTCHVSPSNKLKLDDDTPVSEPGTVNKLDDDALDSEFDTEAMLEDDTPVSEHGTVNKLDDDTLDSESDTEAMLEDDAADSEVDTKSKLEGDTAVSDSDTESAHFNDTDSDGCNGECCDSGKNINDVDWSEEGFVSKSDFEEWSNYSKQIHISGGFDLDFDLGRPLMAGISGLHIEDVVDSELDPVETYETRFGEVCIEALALYNQRNQKSLEFTRVEKANMKRVKGFLYYVTFWAKDNDVERPFRAKLYAWRGKYKIMSCRPKPEEKFTCPYFFPKEAEADKETAMC